MSSNFVCRFYKTKTLLPTKLWVINHTIELMLPVLLLLFFFLNKRTGLFLTQQNCKQPGHVQVFEKTTNQPMTLFCGVLLFQVVHLRFASVNLIFTFDYFLCNFTSNKAILSCFIIPISCVLYIVIK